MSKDKKYKLEHIQVICEGDRLEEIAKELPNIVDLEFASGTGFEVSYNFHSSYGENDGKQIYSAIIKPRWFRDRDKNELLPKVALPKNVQKIMYSNTEKELSFETENFHYIIKTF